jgi:hypothetical protein
MEILRWIKRHWVVIRIENGFNGLENWALKEIGHGQYLLHYLRGVNMIILTFNYLADTRCRTGNERPRSIDTRCNRSQIFGLTS